MKMLKTILMITITASMVACGSKSNTVNESNASQVTFLPAEQLADAQKQAAKEGKMLFIDVSTSWCGYCKKMKKSTYTNAEVAQLFNDNYINISVDAEKGDGIAIAKRYGVNAYPTQIIVNSDLTEQKKNVGYLNPEELIRFGK